MLQFGVSEQLFHNEKSAAKLKLTEKSYNYGKLLYAAKNQTPAIIHFSLHMD